MEKYHTPVMLGEALQFLSIKKDGEYVDCTLGGGGHSSKIAQNLSSEGVLISLDWDEDALNYVRELRKDLKIETDWRIVKSNFVQIKEVLEKQKIGKVDGVLFDLGVSSHQLDDGERGFSFRKDAELDMRMDRELAVSAKDLINGLYRKELVHILTVFGEEPFAKRIAGVIIEVRGNGRIETTAQLNNVIQKVVPFKARKKSAMRVFQALRIAVNDELSNLQLGLPQALEVLAPGGRAVVISFHSLEDRIVKRLFVEAAKSGVGTIISKKPILPSERETRSNPRARSAKMRVFEKH